MKNLIYFKLLQKYIKIHLGVEFEELIGDFIKDEAGTWWLINIKGYLIRPEGI